MKPNNKPVRTSWHRVSSWYNKTVGQEGHYYHQHVVLPGVIRLLNLHEGDSLLDVGCGQGVLARQLPQGVYYQGIDAAPSLIQAALTSTHRPQTYFTVGDATKPFDIQKQKFSHAAIILALQNMEDPQQAILNTSNYLIPGGRLVMVINHPCFRIPRFSSWGVDESKKLQYRRIDRYMSTLRIPVTAAPSQGQASEVTWSFHNPLSSYANFLSQAGMCIETIEEWTSDKTSEGKAARMENRGRSEFPLFMTLVAVKR